MFFGKFYFTKPEFYRQQNNIYVGKILILT